MIKYFKLLVLFLILHPIDLVAAGCGTDGLPRCWVSVINLVATPERYDKKYVMVSGYIDTKMRGPYGNYWLSFHQGEFDPPSMIKLDVTEADLEELGIINGEYYSIVGRFESCSEESAENLFCYNVLRPVRTPHGWLSILGKPKW